MSVNPDRKKKQVLLASLGGVAALGGLYAISQIMSVDQTVLAARNAGSVTTSMIAGKTEAASPEMSWITDGREQMEYLTRQVSALTRALEIQGKARAQEMQDLTASYDELMLQQQAEIEAMKAALQAPSRRSAVPDPALGPAGTGAGGEFVTPASMRAPVSLKSGAPLGESSTGQESGAAAQTSFTPPAPLMPLKRSFALTQRPSDAAPLKEAPVLLQNYLPAGSYAPALVLSGVDASTGVTNAAEPVPVLFRITGAATTAGERSTTGRKIDLTGCTITGSARGDLSSERVYVRLLKMSCIKPGGEVFETDIAGYMSGAGKAGARGLVVSREGKLVRNAGIAGALGGLAGGVSGIGTRVAGADDVGTVDALKSAAGSSVGGAVESAATQLSEYYIERAEQYQPVVSLYGGTEVEVVFLKGVDLG